MSTANERPSGLFSALPSRRTLETTRADFGGWDTVFADLEAPDIDEASNVASHKQTELSTLGTIPFPTNLSKGVQLGDISPYSYHATVSQQGDPSLDGLKAALRSAANTAAEQLRSLRDRWGFSKRSKPGPTTETQRVNQRIYRARMAPIIMAEVSDTTLFSRLGPWLLYWVELMIQRESGYATALSNYGNRETQGWIHFLKSTRSRLRKAYPTLPEWDAKDPVVNAKYIAALIKEIDGFYNSNVKITGGLDSFQVTMKNGFPISRYGPFVSFKQFNLTFLTIGCHTWFSPGVVTKEYIQEDVTRTMEVIQLAISDPTAFTSLTGVDMWELIAQASGLAPRYGLRPSEVEDVIKTKAAKKGAIRIQLPKNLRTRVSIRVTSSGELSALGVLDLNRYLYAFSPDPENIILNSVLGPKWKQGPVSLQSGTLKHANGTAFSPVNVNVSMLSKALVILPGESQVRRVEVSFAWRVVYESSRAIAFLNSIWPTMVARRTARANPKKYPKMPALPSLTPSALQAKDIDIVRPAVVVIRDLSTNQLFELKN